MDFPEFTLHDLLAKSIRRHADKVAIADGERRYSYAQLGSQAHALAAALVAAGVRPGDRVGVYLEKSWEAVVAVFAVSQAAAAFVNINPLLKAQQVQHIVNDAGIRVL